MSIFNRRILAGSGAMLRLLVPAFGGNPAASMPMESGSSLSVHWNPEQTSTRGHAILMMAENPAWDGPASPFRRVRGPGIQAQAVWRSGDTLSTSDPAPCGRSLTLRLRTESPAPHGVRFELRFSHRMVSAELSSLSPVRAFQGYIVRRPDSVPLALHLRTFADGQETLAAEYSGGAAEAAIPAGVPRPADRLVLRLTGKDAAGGIPAGAEFEIAIHMVASEVSPSWPMPATPADAGQVPVPEKFLPLDWPVRPRSSWYPASRFAPSLSRTPSGVSLTNPGSGTFIHLGPETRSFHSLLTGSRDVVDYQIPAAFGIMGNLRRTGGDAWLAAVWSELEDPLPPEDRAPAVMQKSVRVFAAGEALNSGAGIPFSAGFERVTVKAVLPGVAVAGSIAGPDGNPRPFCRSRHDDPRNGGRSFEGAWRQLSSHPGWVCAVSRTLECAGAARHEGRFLPAVWTPRLPAAEVNQGGPWQTIVLPVPAATVEGVAVSLTDNMWVAGWCRTATSGGFRDIGCTWSLGTGQPRLVLPFPGNDGELPPEARIYDISESHLLAGVAGPANSGRACIWKPEGDIFRRSWTAERIAGTAALAINRHGQILTLSGTEALVWPGVSRCLQPLEELAGMKGTALSITDDLLVPFMEAESGCFFILQP